MSYSSDEIRGVLIQAGNERLLLPNATVAEVLSRVPLEPLADTPDWLPGKITWHGWHVPLVVFAKFGKLGTDAVVNNSKIVVLKSQGGDPELPYFALITPTFPQLISVPRDGLLADASEEALPHGILMRVLIGEQSALLPDLETVENSIAEALLAAA